MKKKKIESVRNQCFVFIDPPPLLLKEYVLYTWFNVDNYRRLLIDKTIITF